MRILENGPDIALAARTFIQNVKKGCERLETRPAGSGLDGGVYFHPGFGFWFAGQEGQGGCRMFFGMGRPLMGTEPRPVCDIRLDYSGLRPDAEAFLVRFGSDVLAVHDGRTDLGPGRDFIAFLEAHGYGPTVHFLAELGGAEPEGAPAGPAAEHDGPGDPEGEAGPEAWGRKVVIVSSVTSPDPGRDVLRFVGAMNDFRQWREQDLDGGGNDAGPCDRPASPSSFLSSGVIQGVEPGMAPGPTPGEIPGAAAGMDALLLSGLRETLSRYVQAKGLDYTVSPSPSGGLAGGLTLCSRDGVVLAAFQARPDLSPRGLYDAIGRLLLSRGNVRAAKFLILPGRLGAYYSQALFRHDIQAVRYTLRGMAVVLDADEMFAAIHSK